MRKTKINPRSAIICCSGLGDGLLMMIVAKALRSKGHDVTVFHDLKTLLSPLFPSYSFETYSEAKLSEFDHIYVENDHSERAYRLSALRDQGMLPNLHFFLPTPSKLRREGDYLFHPKLAVATNLAMGCGYFLKNHMLSKQNDLFKHPNEQFRIHPKRIVIHPTSRDPKRNWRPKQFLKLADRLKKKGFFPVFSVSQNEAKEWTWIEKLGYTLIVKESLTSLSQYIHESGYFIGNDSGIGHLASNLNIPTLTISGNPKRVALWRPDWAQNRVATIPFPLPNFKGINFRFRENNWQTFVPVNAVYRQFKRLCLNDK